MSRELSWGVNYTPRQGWFHAWAHLNLESTRQDFAALKELELDHVRVFPLWPLLQPNRTYIDPHAIDAVLSVVDAAGEVGLNVSVDLLQGHLSSFDFLPSWVETWHRRNIFADHDVVEAQKTLGRLLARELSARPHVLGMSLGNEIGQFAAPRHPYQHELDQEQAYGWNRDLLAELGSAFPRGKHQHCFDDDLWFVDSHPFTPRAAIELGHETTVHSWVFGGIAQRYGVNAPELPHFVRYLLEVADMWSRAFGAPSERTIWVQEIGAPTPWVTPERAAEFMEESVRAACGHSRTSAITWWCSHDVSRELADFPEVEYTLGLIDTKGKAKPVGEQLRSYIQRSRSEDLGAVETDSSDPLVFRGLKLDGSNRSITSSTSDACGEWMEAAREGTYRRLELG